MHGFWTIASVLFTLLLAVAAGLYFVFTGPADLDRYPDAKDSPYCLPWPAGKTYLCVQSNRGIVSHRGAEEFAYDFAMPVGSDVCAARAGSVVRIVTEHDGHGYHWPNNLIAIKHDDGTLAYYLHIQKDGARVTLGDTVKQGQVIAASGHVGNSMLPHLHFHVRGKEREGTLPVTFSDIEKDAGIPRMFKRYTSGNALAP